MNLFLRLLRVLFTARGRGAMGALDTSVLRFRVWPGDLDLNLHMNNGRYLTVMDLGRTDLILRTGLLRHVLRRKWIALVGSATIQYRRSLGPFARYELHTRILAWDEKWFFIEQRFRRGGELIALGVVKALLRGRDGNVPPAEVLAAVGEETASPTLPEPVRAWVEAERALADGR